MRKDGKYPQEIGGSKVVRVRDLTTGYDNGQPDNKAILPTQVRSGATNRVVFCVVNKPCLCGCDCLSTLSVNASPAPPCSRATCSLSTWPTSAR